MKNLNGVFLMGCFLLLLACAKVEPTRLTNIEGLLPDLSFSLMDENKHKVTEADYLGQTVVVFFGFTSCSEACPNTLYKLSKVLTKLGDLERQVTVLFISVDPKRDSLEKLKQYTDVFGVSFIGLRGEFNAIKQLSKQYRVTFGYGDADSSGSYEVSHSSGAFIFDKEGGARLLATQDSSVDAIFSDIKYLINPPVL